MSPLVMFNHLLFVNTFPARSLSRSAPGPLRDPETEIGPGLLLGAGEEALGPAEGPAGSSSILPSASCWQARGRNPTRCGHGAVTSRQCAWSGRAFQACLSTPALLPGVREGTDGWVCFGPSGPEFTSLSAHKSNCYLTHDSVSLCPPHSAPAHTICGSGLALSQHTLLDCLD